MSSKKDRAMRHTHRILPTKIGGTYGDADVRTPKPSRAERREARRAHEEIRAAILENAHAGRATFDGLSTDEIAAYNRRIMFGDDDEAFPGDAEWSRVVD